jgi:class 3 adenylate cyclase
VKLVVTAFVTVDGIVEAPGFDEHRTGRNAWALRVQRDEDQRFNAEHVMSADALLLGRRTWQIWAAFWPTAATSGADPELADWMNQIPKFVVSNTMKRADWSNTTILSGDIAAEVRKLKAQQGGDILVYGSPDLVDELLRQNLVDEFRLLWFPVILGSGKRLFRDRIDTHHLRLVSTRTFESGVVLHTYVPDPEVPTSRFVDDYQWTHEQIRSLHAAEDFDRTLATVLFADIVDSTGRAHTMGDRSWRKLLDTYHQAVREVIEHWNGQNIEFTGDGVMAEFDAPTRALRAGFELVEAARGLDVEIRVGLHTGEIERRETGVGGIAVHIAARLLSQAEPNQVIVTKTVRDLVTGTDLTFRPLGPATLRGVPVNGRSSRRRRPSARNSTGRTGPQFDAPTGR